MIRGKWIGETGGEVDEFEGKEGVGRGSDVKIVSDLGRGKVKGTE